MKIKHLTFIAIISFIFLMGALSIGFYNLERQLDHGYVWMYELGLFVFILGIITAAFIGVRRLIVAPLEKITQMVQSKEQEYGQYFIKELSTLSQTLSITFRTLWLQQIKVEEALEETRYLDRIMQTIADINEYLISAGDIDELMQKCMKRLREHQGYGECWIALVKDGTLEVRGCTEGLAEFLHVGMKISLDQEERNAFSPSIKAFDSGSAVKLQELNTQDSLETWSFIAKEKGYGSFIALPLISRTDEKPFGILSVYALSSEGFRPKEVKMLQELSGDIGFAIHAYMQREEFRRHLGIDAVSGLPNRVSLIDYLSLHPISALAILNIDRFSDINDVYGVTIGDQVLAGYGHWLLKKVEKTAGTFLYKLGSDEYALVFDEQHDSDDDLAFLECLIDKTEEESFVVEGIEVILSITIGVDFKSEKQIENATRALKQAKLQRKKLSIYTPLIGAKKEQANNIQWYKEIKEALEEDRIVPYFQPIVDNKSHKIIKYEALIRLIKRDGTVVSPFYFLEISKKIRLYSALTKIMFDKVLVCFENSDIPVSINLSTEDLMDAELGNYMEEQLKRYNIGKSIIFEILESEGIGNYTEVSTFIERFKTIGCSFAIDDFGSGFSNFDHLLRLNIDTLKIDGSLIRNLAHDRNAQIIVRHICDFAHEMGISTIAEFVADEAIYRKVLEIGIDASQGYFFYEPSPYMHR